MVTKIFGEKKKVTVTTAPKPAPVIAAPVVAPKPKPKPMPKFSAAEEALIQAEVDRVKAAKHQQMIAEEIQNRLGL